MTCLPPLQCCPLSKSSSLAVPSPQSVARNIGKGGWRLEHVFYSCENFVHFTRVYLIGLHVQKNACVPVWPHGTFYIQQNGYFFYTWICVLLCWAVNHSFKANAVHHLFECMPWLCHIVVCISAAHVRKKTRHTRRDRYIWTVCVVLYVPC